MPRKSPTIEHPLPAEQTDDEAAPSRSARKRASEELQALGEALVDLRPDLIAALPVPEALRDAVAEARRVTAFSARRRQGQLIGKLMRRLDEEAVAAVREALQAGRGESAKDTALLHRAEQWRTDLLADDEKLSKWLAEHPATDAQRLRALIRQARKDAHGAPPDEGQRHGRAYRELFRMLRAELAGQGVSKGSTPRH